MFIFSYFNKNHIVLYSPLLIGYFPYLFNNRANEYYIGPLPDKHYYGYNKFSAPEKRKFDTWYDQRLQEGLFDMQREIHLYCLMDVLVLGECSMEYRKRIIEITETDPFCGDFCTLAGVCMGKIFCCCSSQIYI